MNVHQHFITFVSYCNGTGRFYWYYSNEMNVFYEQFAVVVGYKSRIWLKSTYLTLCTLNWVMKLSMCKFFAAVLLYFSCMIIYFHLRGLNTIFITIYFKMLSSDVLMKKVYKNWPILVCFIFFVYDWSQIWHLIQLNKPHWWQ